MDSDKTCAYADEELEDLLYQLPPPKHPDYMYCPHCERTKGRWWGYRVHRDGTVIRGRMCFWCKKVYAAASYRNVHRKVSLNDAKRFLRSENHYAQFVDFVDDMNVPLCSRR